MAILALDFVRVSVLETVMPPLKAVTPFTNNWVPESMGKDRLGYHRRRRDFVTCCGRSGSQ